MSDRLLFSYGSNHPDQLVERIGNVKGMFGAYAPNHKRVFRGMSTRWSGGVASLVSGRGRPAFGYVATVSDAQLDRMDEFEGVASGNYRREIVDVIVLSESGEVELEAVAYVSTSKVFNKPSKAYLNAVAKTIGTFWDISGPKDIKVE